MGSAVKGSVAARCWEEALDRREGRRSAPGEELLAVRPSGALGRTGLSGPGYGDLVDQHEHVGRVPGGVQVAGLLGRPQPNRSV